MSSESSCSDNEIEKLKAAIDPVFLNDNIYSKDVREEDHKPAENKLSSLRNRSQQYRKSESINPFNIKVTPEFRRHVAQHLSKILDKLIEEEDVPFQVKGKPELLSNVGVKLLKSSKSYLDQSHKNQVNFVQKKVTGKGDLKNSDFQERAKKVAVSGEWILSQKETEHWEVINKGSVEIISIRK